MPVVAHYLHSRTKITSSFKKPIKREQHKRFIPSFCRICKSSAFSSNALYHRWPKWQLLLARMVPDGGMPVHTTLQHRFPDPFGDLPPLSSQNTGGWLSSPVRRRRRMGLSCQPAACCSVRKGDTEWPASACLSLLLEQRSPHSAGLLDL